MRYARPYIVVIVLVAQLLSGGLLGPRMLCAHRDGRQNIEWAATSCCGGGCTTAASLEHDRDGFADGCREHDGRLALSQPDCDCVDSPMAGEPMVRPAPQATPQDNLVATFVALVAVLVIDLSPVNPSGFVHRAALSECLAPPRAHLATIVLRL